MMIPGSPSKCITLFFIFFLLTGTPALFAQQNNPLINSGELLEQGNKLHEEAKYKEAIALYEKISRSDTSYSDAVYELAYSCYSDSQMQRGHQYALDGMKNFPDEFARFALVDGSILDVTKRTPEAIELYNDGLKRNPHSAILYYNKGVTLITENKPAEAKKNLEQCVLINPYYSSAHYYIGKLYYEAGNMVAAMLAFKTYLMVAPEGKYVSNVVKMLGNMAKVTDDVMENVKKYKPGKEDNFDLQQQILLSKIAFDKEYKLKADLEDQIVRQIQVVDEKLEYRRNDTGFCMQFYVPLYSKLFKDGQFEPLVFTIFSGLNIKSVKEWNNKNKKQLQAFSNAAVTYLNEIRDSRVLIATERKNAPAWYVFEDGKFIAKGTYKVINDKKAFVGPWEFFYDNGTISAKGVYNDAEKKTGDWYYYYKNGQLKERTNYVNNVAQGLSEGWFVNGNKWFTESYKDDKLDGTATLYYYNGVVKNIIEYKAGERNGEQKNYSSSGTLLSKQTYSMGKQNGDGFTYFSNGKVQDQLGYKDDKAVGLYKSYYASGAANEQGEFIDGMRQGPWIEYYENGITKEKTTYKDGEFTGEFTQYHENGVLSSKGNYTKKKIDGPIEYFDDDSIKYSTALYEKGRLKEINFFDKKGNTIFSNTTRRGAANITFFSPEGIKVSEGYFDKEGLKQGKFTQYFTSGKISAETNYKDGQEDGPATEYYSSGQKRYERSFKDGTEDGYAKGYFLNGKLSYEGWVVDGRKDQHFFYYNLVGDTIEKVYYRDNEPDGYTEFRYPGNIPNMEYRYKTGWLEEIIQFDSTGNILSSNVLKQGAGPLVYKHYNGKISGSGNYKAYMLTGPYTTYFFDGSLRSTSHYINDERDSIYKEYYYGGILRVEGKYHDGKKTGVWKYYYKNGKLKDEATYKDGKQDGPDRSYSEDGTFDKAMTFKDDELQGEYKMYGDNNQLAVLFYYKDGVLQSYSYEDKTGKLVPPIEMKNATGKVVAYYKNGTQSAEINFFNNDVHGVRKIFTTAGKPFIDGTRESGYDHGIKKIYYASGSIMKEENYVFGNNQGLFKTYHPNGKIEKEENWYNDDLHGTCKYYDMQGKLRQTRVYFYGNLLSAK